MPATVLAHIKGVERVLRFAKNWQDQPNFPVNKARYVEQLTTAHCRVSRTQKEWIKKCQTKKAESKVNFRKKGPLPMNDIRNYFSCNETINQVTASFEWLEKYVAGNGNVILLGDGRKYDHVLAHHWNIVLRRLTAQLSVLTKRTSAIQGITIAEFESREKTDEGFHLVIGEHKNADLNQDSIMLSSSEEQLWRRFYVLRLLCRKEGPWPDKNQLFVNICGKSPRNITVNINKTIGSKEHTINGRTMRTYTATVSKLCSPSKRNNMISFLNHSEGTDNAMYKCPTVDDTIKGQNAIKEIQTCDSILTTVVPKITELWPYDDEAVFPDKEEIEDILDMKFGITVTSLDSNVYAELRSAWREANTSHIVSHFASSLPSFDEKKILTTLRSHAEWKEKRFQIRDLVKKRFEEKVRAYVCTLIR
ncbi:hypothetical protein ONE63_011482 [Megalurothrips usitatus]|uniref:Uncharacterized protein n=1 Tax=Megalurothrips usitatus TaxID=439358 RepID=A0AAV7X5K6_9NEOP|nr:hypothetical protein ONE63_011482 [Megalurothrips usitatus]